MSPSVPPAVSPDPRVGGTIQVRRATPADVPALTGVLVRAFADDPLVAWAVRPDTRRGDAYRRLFDLFLRRLTLPHGEVYTTTDLRGAALWTPPGTWRQGLWQQVAQLPDWLAVVGPRSPSGGASGAGTPSRVAACPAATVCSAALRSTTSRSLCAPTGPPGPDPFARPRGPPVPAPHPSTARWCTETYPRGYLLIARESASRKRAS